MITDLIVRILAQSGVDHKGGLREGIPFILAVASDGELAPVVFRSTSEEPPLTLGELVETAQVGAAAASFVKELQTPLA